MTAEAARARPVEVLMAGPAAGTAAAVHVARRSNLDGAVALDTGGTTQLVSVVRGGAVRPSIESRLEGYPVRVPMVDVRPVGAGGGSIARVDEAGMLRVGPESAGADPGPACYGRGGQEPTVTDADLVLGYLNPERFLGGGLRLDPERARAAIEGRVGAPLRLDPLQAAGGIVQVVDTARVSGIRRVLIEQGLDPRDFSLVAFGGAGPVHAARLAAELGMARVIVPLHPGLASPLGALTGDLRRDFVRTVGASVERVAMSRLRDLATELQGRAAAELAERVDEMDVAADMKYAGQLHETMVPLTGVAFAEEDRARLRRLFLDEHRRLYGYAIEEEGVDLVNLRVVARRRFPTIPDPSGERGGEDPGSAHVGERCVHFPEYGTQPTPIFDRERLRPGNRVEGPAVVEEYDSTTVVPPGQTCRVDQLLQLEITPAGAAR
jgi:N-methylhydantoinase A